jgi:hypothetical protein
MNKYINPFDKNIINNKNSKEALAETEMKLYKEYYYKSIKKISREEL